MGRWLNRILNCLLLGALSTVGVAWATAHWMSFRNIDRSETEIVLTAFGKARIVGAAAYRDSSGWPMYAMMFHGVVSPNAGTLDTIQWGWRTTRSGQRLEMVRDPSGHRYVYLLTLDRALPLRPILPGFTIDTLLYGVLWFGVIVGFGAMKRALRTRRGRCPLCAYDLRGDLDGGCPECGWNREP